MTWRKLKTSYNMEQQQVQWMITNADPTLGRLEVRIIIFQRANEGSHQQQPPPSSFHELNLGPQMQYHPIKADLWNAIAMELILISKHQLKHS